MIDILNTIQILCFFIATYICTVSGACVWQYNCAVVGLILNHHIHCDAVWWQCFFKNCGGLIALQIVQYIHLKTITIVSQFTERNIGFQDLPEPKLPRTPIYVHILITVRYPSATPMIRQTHHYFHSRSFFPLMTNILGSVFNEQLVLLKDNPLYSHCFLRRS